MVILFFFSSSPPRQLLIAVGTAGPQLPASDLSGHRWSTTISRYQSALLELNPGTSRVQWAQVETGVRELPVHGETVWLMAVFF